MGDTCYGQRADGRGLLLNTKHTNPSAADTLWDEEMDVGFEVKEVSADGTFTGYGSTFGNMDSDRDVIAPGAFSKSLSRRKIGDIKLLWQHDPREPIGVWEEMTEDSRGLKVKGRLLINQNVPLADKAYALMKAGALSSMSIGFAIPRDGYEIDEKKRVRVIKEADLWECSIVTFPANPKAKIQRVKSAVPYQDLPLADRGRAWDSATAEKRVRQWAGGASNIEDMDWSKYRQGFLWFDSDNPEAVTSYKLGIADVVSGELMAIPRGIFAAAGVLMGARGGVDIPDEAKARAQSHLERYYSKMDLESPFKMIDMGDALKSYGVAMLAACDGPVSFKQTLTELGFSKKQAEDVSSQIDPRTEAEENHEAEAKLKEAMALLQSLNPQPK